MKRLTAMLMLLVALASPVWAQDYGTPSSGTNTTTTTNDNNATTTDNATEPTATDDTSLPATASPLPLLLLVGVGALASSLWMRRRRQA